MRGAHHSSSKTAAKSFGIGVANKSLDFVLKRRRREGVGTSRKSSGSRLLRLFDGRVAARSSGSSGARLLRRLDGVVAARTAMSTSAFVVSWCLWAEEAMPLIELRLRNGVANLTEAGLLRLLGLRLDAGVSAWRVLLWNGDLPRLLPQLD